MNAHSAWIPCRGHSFIFIFLLSNSNTLHADINCFCKNYGHLASVDSKDHQKDSKNCQNNSCPFCFCYFFYHSYLLSFCRKPALLVITTILFYFETFASSFSTIFFHSSRLWLPEYVSPTIFPSLSTKKVSGKAEMPFRRPFIIVESGIRKG